VSNQSYFAGLTRPSLNSLIVGISFVSALVALALLATTGATVVVLERAIVHFLPGPAIVNLGAAVLALLAALATRRRRRWSPRAVLIFLGAMAIAGMCASLLYRDDYSGGSCGEFDWASGHLHAGYPYSWLDGFVCVPHFNTLAAYLQAHPEKASWYPDLLALSVDFLFWLNVGILAYCLLTILKLPQRLQKYLLILPLWLT
jgi:hypothetical protein